MQHPKDPQHRNSDDRPTLTTTATVGEGAPAPLGTAHQPASSPASRSHIWIIGSALLVLVVAIGVLAVVLTRPDGAERATEDRRSPTPLAADAAESSADDAAAKAVPETSETAAAPTLAPVDALPELPGPAPVIASVSASGQAPAGIDACTPPNTQTYDAANVLDGFTDTAWRVAGSGLPHTITINLHDRSTVSSVGIAPGLDKTDPCDGTWRYPQTRRPTRVRWTIGDQVMEQTLADNGQVQTITFTDEYGAPASIQTQTITLEFIAETAPGDRDFLSVSEVRVG